MAFRANDGSRFRWIVGGLRRELLWSPALARTMYLPTKKCGGTTCTNYRAPVGQAPPLIGAPWFVVLLVDSSVPACGLSDCRRQIALIEDCATRQTAHGIQWAKLADSLMSPGISLSSAHATRRDLVFPVFLGVAAGHRAPGVGG